MCESDAAAAAAADDDEWDKDDRMTMNYSTEYCHKRVVL